jgi:pimeloyl-ACP methyl ester carboxylesterase
VEIRSGYAPHGDIELHYEDLGDENDPAVLLIMGLGMQLVAWPEPFVRLLVDRGLRVIRLDNRDAGLSQGFDERGVPNLAWQGLRHVMRLPVQAPYSLDDMAADALGVLDALGIAGAHVVGASMGGMIAQVFAARYRQRTGGLGIIFSSNNSPLLPPPAPRALLSLIKGPPPDSPREVIVENSVRVSKIIGSPGYPKSEGQLRADAVENYERCFYPQGIGRHFAAILGSGSLGRYDRQITAPTVVIHGRADILMRPSGGRAIARSIRGARLVVFDGMAHDMPEPLFDDMVAELTATFAEAQVTGSRPPAR